MAIKKQINIKVTETGLDEINKDLVSLDQNITKVDDSSKGASKGLKDVGENGGAIAVLDSLTGGLATRIRDAAEASKLFNFSLKGMRTALIATGIGAFVVAVGLVIAYWDEIKIALSDTNFLLGRQITQLESVASELESQLSIIDKRMELNKLEGKSNEELQKQKLAIIEQEQEINRTLIEKLEWQLENEKALSKELTLWEKIQVEALRLVDPAKAAALEAASQLENNERTFELQQKINEAKAKQVDLEIAIYKEQNPEVADGGGGATIQDRDLGGIGNELEAEKAIAVGKLDIQKEFNKQSLDLTDDLERAKELKRQQELFNEQVLAEQKIAVTQQALGAVVDILGEASGAGKAAASALAVINTWQGVTEVLKSPSTFPEPLATISRIASTASVLASGFKAVQAINSQKLPSFAKGGQTANVSGGGVSAPSFNVVGTSGVNQLAQTLQGQDEPIRAYVTSGDMTTQQTLDRNIIETATIS